ncbi:MAG: diguanylate cyclase [Acidimicrobiia bacterium]|nr:diguanylate cyclase [Acidimicrobiia bacterium]
MDERHAPESIVPDRRDSLAARLRRAFSVVLVGIGVTALVSAGVFGYVFLKARPEEHRLLLAGQEARLAHLAMVDQETGIRGFLLSGQRQYLEPYLSGTRDLRTEEALLVRDIGGDRGLAHLLIDRRVAEQAWFDQWATPAVQGQPLRDPAQLDAFVASGKTLFDAYRQKHAVLTTAVDARRNRAINAEGLALGVCAVVELAVLLATALLARRQSRRLEAVVVPPVADLVDVIGRVRDGDLDARVSGDGPAELHEIGVGLTEMTEALAEARRLSEARQEELAEQAERLNRVLTMSREVAGSLNLKYVLRAVVTSTVSLGPFTKVVVWLLDEPETRLYVAYDSSVTAGRVGTVEELELGRDLVGQAAQYGRTMTRGVDNVFRTVVGHDMEVSGVAVPMVVGARVIGVLKCFAEPPAAVSPMTIEVLETLASQAGTAVEAARLHERTEQLSQTDALTRLFNRRRLEADLEAECYRATRYGRPLAFVMLDVDHFKRFNDRFGHQRGDEALEMVAKVVAESARDSDTPYRFGGEELAVLCRETDAAGAAEFAERLRAGIERRLKPEGITASFGVAAVGPGTSSPGELVQAADKAMYAAKHAGRNQVAIAGASGVDQPAKLN